MRHLVAAIVCLGVVVTRIPHFDAGIVGGLATKELQEIVQQHIHSPLLFLSGYP